MEHPNRSLGQPVQTDIEVNGSTSYNTLKWVPKRSFLISSITTLIKRHYKETLMNLFHTFLQKVITVYYSILRL